MTPKQQQAWEAWLAERPPQVRAVAERLPAGRPYRLTTTGQKVWIYCYDEHPDSSVTLKIDANHDENPDTLNAILGLGGPTGVRVFGINPDDLVPWENK